MCNGYKLKAVVKELKLIWYVYNILIQDTDNYEDKILLFLRISTTFSRSERSSIILYIRFEYANLYKIYDFCSDQIKKLTLTLTLTQCIIKQLLEF